MGTFKLTRHALWIWLLVCKSAQGNDIDCSVDCACCIDDECGSDEWFDTGVCINGCIDGYAGNRCYKPCPVNCVRCYSKAHQEICADCHDGYYPGPDRDCTSECLPYCKTCTSDSSCTSCKEGYQNANGYSDCRYLTCTEYCKCENDQCVSCKNGYYNISNACTSICPGNCVTCSSSNNCDSCKDGYYNGYQYDDSSLPLLNDCTYECQNNCERCTAFNVCLICKSGYYGLVCEKSCSIGCLSNICNIQTGICQCSPDFAGDGCDICIDGKYGNMCDKQCSTGCKGNLCDKDFGNCKDGCIVDTIIGDKCDVCVTGWYGPYCNLSCSVGCKNNQCNRADGECTHGCLNNVKGTLCDQCINGKYGDLCNNNCPKGCDEVSCLKESGNCIECVQNFDGEKCDRCVNGFYGITCSERCPSNCLNKECDRYLGTCIHGCVDNFSGDKCCTNNNNCITCLSYTTCKQCKTGYFTDQCAETCHENCIDSCNIESGICDDCKITFYGDHCQFSCSPTCQVQTNVREKRCHRQDGTCRHGCIDGFYGIWCSQNCSSDCIDNICDQDDGECLKGCLNNGYDNSNCTSVSEPVSSEQSLNIAAVVLGTILAVSLVGYIILGAILIFRKCLQRKLSREPVYENSAVELNSTTDRNVNDSSSMSQAFSSNDMTSSLRNYDNLSGVQGIEHEYGKV